MEKHIKDMLFILFIALILSSIFFGAGYFIFDWKLSFCIGLIVSNAIGNVFIFSLFKNKNMKSKARI